MSEENIFPINGTGKRYLSYDNFLKQKFGTKAAKLTLDAGFTCPNRDGSKGVGGCIFCGGRNAGDFCAKGSIKEQLEIKSKEAKEKWKTDKFIPYFQAGSCTYAHVEELRVKYFEALSFPGAVGLSIATRADCLSDEICDLLKEISDKTFLTVELGLQSTNDLTAERINRCHNYKEFLEGFNKLRSRKINICVHLINGLPFETREDMLNSARQTALLKPEFVKIHLLYVIKNTPLEEMYLRKEFETMSMEEYVDITCSQIELFPQNTVFERLTGDGKNEDLISPRWSRRKREVLNEVDKELKRRNSFQGAKYKE